MSKKHVKHEKHPNPNIAVRGAVEADIPAITDLIRHYVDQGILLARTLDEMIELLPGFFVAVMDDGKLVGCAALEIYSPKLAEVRSVAVAPEAQGMGVGSLLVDACVERAREHRIFEVMAITSQDAFFKSCGFDYTLSGAKRAVFLQTREHYTDHSDNSDR
ncbi:MAG: GNAT family N-acetyltransferase [Chloroflexi bacterium]|nr:GNAT family N-acetyltransferase [Chloroflexota bacterium]